MKLQNIANLFFTLCFLGFIGFGMIVTVIRPKETQSYFENRALASIPILNGDSVLDGSWFSGWETYLKDHAAGRNTLIKTGTYIDLFVLHRPVVNDIVVTDKALLSFNNYETVDAANIAAQSTKSVENLAALDKIVETNGGVFYYVTVSGQLAYDHSVYPSYLNNRAEYFTTALGCFKADMADRQLKLIDMGEVFETMGHPDSMYAATDHHYTFDGAMITYQTIMETINADNHLSLPVLSAENITIKELENPFLGSRMRKVFNLLETDDKLKIGLLNQAIPFTRTDNGSPSEPFVYSLPQNTWDTVSYTVYMGGDVAETVMSTDRPALPNVLIIGDSYTNAVECLLYTGFNEMRSLDLRFYTDKTLAAYIEDYRPDIVILLRDYSVLLSVDGNSKVY